MIIFANVEILALLMKFLNCHANIFFNQTQISYILELQQKVDKENFY